MEYTYTVPIDLITGEPSTSIILRSDDLFIPTDPANADYQAYLNKDTLPSNSSDFSQPIGGNE
jgi:hypothetical protein